MNADINESSEREEITEGDDSSGCWDTPKDSEIQ